MQQECQKHKIQATESDLIMFQLFEILAEHTGCLLNAWNAGIEHSRSNLISKIRNHNILFSECSVATESCSIERRIQFLFVHLRW